MILLALLEVQRAARVVLVPGSSQVLLQLHECPSRLLGLSLGLRNVRPASVSSPPPRMNVIQLILICLL